MDKKQACSLGLLMGGPARESAHVNEEELDKHLPGVGSKATYTQAAGRVDSNLGKRLLSMDFDNLQHKALKFMDSIGVPVKDIYLSVADPVTVLGEEVVQSVERIYQDHIQNYGTESPDTWKKVHGPEIAQIKETIMPNLDPAFSDYAKKYFDMHIGGGQLYHMPQEGALGRLATNTVGNLVSWNPMITTMNVFEFSPKALAYATEVAGPQGITAITKAMARFAQATAGKFWSKIPELDELGVYGVREHAGVGKVEQFLRKYDLINITEHPLRGLSYYVGDELQKMGFQTDGATALEKIAFINRFGNEPMVFLDHQQKSTLTLMRYTVASAKFYTRLLQGVAKGDPKAIGAFLIFSGVTALQTGTSSSIPTPVHFALTKFDPEIEQSFADIDNATGMNLVQHLFGTDLSKQARPFAGPALGVGYTLATTNVKSAYSSFGKATEAAGQGDISSAAIHSVQAFMDMGQLARIPGVNMTSKRAVDTLAKVVDQDVSLDEAPTELLKSTKIYTPPETE